MSYASPLPYICTYEERTATLEIGALLVLEGSRFPFLLIIAICNDPPSMSQLLLKS
jgi:hypothetical protein